MPVYDDYFGFKRGLDMFRNSTNSVQELYSYYLFIL